MSGLTGRLRNVSGDLAAAEASFERKGSLGLMGGVGILTEALEPIQEAAKRVLRGLGLVLRKGNDDEEEDEIEVAMGVK